MGNQYYRDVVRRLPIMLPMLDRATLDQALAKLGATPETVTETQMRQALRGIVIPLLAQRAQRSVVAPTQAGLILTDAKNCVLAITPDARLILGVAMDAAIIGRPVQAVAELADCIQNVESFPHANAVLIAECITHADERRVRCISHLRTAADGSALGVSTTVQDITVETAMYTEADALYRASETRVQELSALAEIARIVALATDLDATLAAITERTVRLVGCRAAAIFLPDYAGRMFLRGHFGLPDDYAETINAFLDISPAMPEEQQPPTTLAFRDGIPVHRSLRAIPPDAPSSAVATRDIGLTHGWSSIVAVPLVAQGEAIGALTCYLAQNDPPDDAMLRLITTIGDQAALAVRNSTLYAETGRQLAEMTALHRSAALLNSRLDRETVLQTIVEQAAEVTGARACILHELAADGSGTVLRAIYGLEHYPFPDLPILRFGPPIYAIQQRAAVLIRNREDAKRMPWWQPDFAARTPEWRPEFAKRLKETQWGGMIVVPFGYEGTYNAALMLIYDHAINPGESEMQLIATFADHAAIAMHNMQLYEQAQQMAALEERHRLARDLHDSVTQSLFSMSLLAQVLPTLWEMRPEEAAQSVRELGRLSKEALAEMRALLFQLRPVTLEEEGLGEALRKHIESLQRRDGPLLTCIIAEDAVRLPLPIEESLFRIASEAVGNALKHAHATRIAMTLENAHGITTLTVSDDGRGFDPDGHQTEPGHLGLPGMRERAGSIGGRLTIESAPGAGTTVTIRVATTVAGHQ